MIELLCPKYLVPVRPRGQVLEGHCVAIDRSSGEILKILPAGRALAEYPGAAVHRLETHALLPGLVNMHTHSPMTLLRGYADDLRLDQWLQEHIWPAEARWANGEWVQLGTELAIAEMLRGGTTCFNENYFFPDRMAEVVEASGLRACIGIPVIGVETQWATGPDEYIEKGLAVVSKHTSDRVRFSLAPHSMYTLEEHTLRRIAGLAKEMQVPVHMHLLEVEWEIKNSKQVHGLAPLQHADQLGLLNDRLIAVHMAHLSDADIALLTERAVNVVHCPQSNLKLASGVCRLADLLGAGVNVAIGTDSAASNNDLDLLDELRTAALLAKGLSGDPCVVDAETALELATINGARALGLEQRIGSIERGKQADFCAINLDYPRTQPVHHVISQVVYSAASSQVSDVWVSGKRLLENGVLKQMDENQLLKRVASWAAGIEAGAARAAGARS